MNSRIDFLSRLVHAAQHPMFRIAAIVFAIFSSLSIYDFYLPLATSLLWHIALVGMVGAVVALQYFTLRGLSHRLLQKRSVVWYVLVGVLCFLVEVFCTLYHAASVYLTGVQALAFHQAMFWPVLFVLCSIPIFGPILAALDVDLMAEKGAIPSHQVTSQPIQPNRTAPNTAYGAGANPQANYPPMTPPVANASYQGGYQPRPGGNGAGQPNNLKNHYAQQQSQPQPQTVGN